MTIPLQVIQSVASAESLLKPERTRMVEALREQEDSAAGVARRLNLPRQTVNYHIKELEKDGLIEFVEQRAKGNCLERVMRTTARSYVISPAVLGRLGVGESDAKDRFSSAYLVSAASRVIRDVAAVREQAAAAGKTVATLAVETEIRFASAAARKHFTEELTAMVAALAARYHDDVAPKGRKFRLLAAAYPSLSAGSAASVAPVAMD